MSPGKVTILGPDFSLQPALPELPALPIEATLPPGDGLELGDEGEGVPVLLKIKTDVVTQGIVMA